MQSQVVDYPSHPNENHTNYILTGYNTTDVENPQEIVKTQISKPQLKTGKCNHNRGKTFNNWLSIQPKMQPSTKQHNI